MYIVLWRSRSLVRVQEVIWPLLIPTNVSNYTCMHIHVHLDPYFFKTTPLRLPKSVLWFSAWLTIISMVSSLVTPFCPEDFEEMLRDLPKSFNSGDAIRFNVSLRSVSWSWSSKKPAQWEDIASKSWLIKNILQIYDIPVHKKMNFYTLDFLTQTKSCFPPLSR